jgi:hypothetical protein
MVVQLYYNSQLPVVFGILAPLVVISRWGQVGAMWGQVLRPGPALPCPFQRPHRHRAHALPPRCPRAAHPTPPHPPCRSLKLWNFWIALDLIFGGVQALAFLAVMTWRCCHRGHPLEDM